MPTWRGPHPLENQLPAAFAVAVALVLQLVLPSRLQLVHPSWLLAVLEFALLAVLIVFELLPQDVDLRVVSLILLALVTIDNTVSSALLAMRMLLGYPGLGAGSLVMLGASIWITNVIVYGLAYWLLDRGGPHARARAASPHPELLFPQMQAPEIAPPSWRPVFLDYLYVSFTNATAFSPTDTLPLSVRAKGLMGAQSAVALVTMALVFARAVNILPG